MPTTDEGRGAGGVAAAGDSLAAATLAGARWTYLATFINAVLQVAVTAVLARLLLPQAFGLVAMGMLVLRFGQYFASMGMTQAVVQRRDLRDEHVAAGFWAALVALRVQGRPSAEERTAGDKDANAAVVLVGARKFHKDEGDKSSGEYRELRLAHVQVDTRCCRDCAGYDALELRCIKCEVPGLGGWQLALHGRVAYHRRVSASGWGGRMPDTRVPTASALRTALVVLRRRCSWWATRRRSPATSTPWCWWRA